MTIAPLRRMLVLLAILSVPLVLSLAAQQAEQGPKAVATASKAMVSSSHPEVTRTMLEVLRKGGNAVDAMITAMVLQPILEPQMSTLAGGMGALIYDAKSAKLYYLDAELDHTAKGAPITAVMAAPSGVVDTSGRRIGVPGTVAGLRVAAERFGTMKWADYFQPAIRLAEQGYPMYSFLYAEMAAASLGRLGAMSSGREEFMPDGFVPPVGTVVRRPRLAKMLQRLASDGPDYFYKGEWAHRFVDAVNATGGAITLDDLAGYQARWEEPLRTTYRDVEIASPPPPSNGGLFISMVMNMAEQFGLEKMPHYTESARTLVLLRRIFSAAETNVIEYVHDPLSANVPIDTLLSKDYAKMLARLIDGSWPTATTGAAPLAPAQMSPFVGDATVHDPLYSDTNHLVIADAMGNWVSVTHTIYGSTFATGLVVDGVVANSGNSFPGTASGKGRRVVSPFPATMVMRAGKPWLAIGSPGLASKAVAIALVNLLGFKKDLYASVDAPRFDGNEPTQNFQVETRVPDEVRAGLAAFGIRVQPTAPYSWHFGSVQAVMRDEKTGGLIGVADPRRAGFAAGY
jgi:gamma-glutamyltranspeptidase/glutathione hydrolase